MYLLLKDITLSIRSKDFCILNATIEEEVICKKYQCGFDLCSVDNKSCENLNAWNMIIKKYANESMIEIEKLDKFLDNIKECESNEYISLKEQVCSIKQTCKLFQKYMSDIISKSKIRTSTKSKPRSCVCSGKFSFRCGRYFCTESKFTCNRALRSLNDSTYLKHINNC
jgi:hypothetical protein